MFIGLCELKVHSRPLWVLSGLTNRRRLCSASRAAYDVLVRPTLLCNRRRCFCSAPASTAAPSTESESVANDDVMSAFHLRIATAHDRTHARQRRLRAYSYADCIRTSLARRKWWRREFVRISWAAFVGDESGSGASIPQQPRRYSSTSPFPRPSPFPSSPFPVFPAPSSPLHSPPAMKRLPWNQLEVWERCKLPMWV